MNKIPKNQVILQKYGGTSVGSVQKIQNVAKRIKQYYKNQNKIIVVVSAMGKTTDALVKLALQITSNPHKREMDMLLSTGEQVSIALLAMALEAIDIPAISFTGSQIGIITDGNFANARIKDIDTKILRKELNKNKVCIVAGFQGVDINKNITTLGRGGSDTSAVALAAALKTSECEIFTDVDGVYSADPRFVRDARKINKISYDEMLELASLGAGVLHSRAVEVAKNYRLVLHVRSSLNFNIGTLVIPEEKIMEKLVVTGVTLKEDEYRISLSAIPDKPGIAASIFEVLAKNKINVDMIVQSSGEDKKNTISFTIPKNDLNDTTPLLESLVKKWKTGFLMIDTNITILSIVGVGMKSNVGVASALFNILAKNKINIEMISTSEIKISCVIQKKYGKKALKLIHSHFIV